MEKYFKPLLKGNFTLIVIEHFLAEKSQFFFVKRISDFIEE